MGRAQRHRGEQYQEDVYFDPDARGRRSLKLVDCPLPEIESEYAAQAMLKRVDTAREQNQPKAGSAFDWEAARQQCPDPQRLQEERESLPVWKRGDAPAR